MKNNILIVMFYFLAYTHSQAQVSYGGTPYSFGSDFKKTNLVQSAPPVFTIPMLDMPKIKQQDNETVNSTRFAAATAVAINIETHGLWQTLPTGDKLWRIQLQTITQEVTGMRLFFEAFSLPAGGKLFIYSPDHQIMLGAFTENNNKPSYTFATTLIESKNVWIEYIEPAGRQGQARLKINRIDQAYRITGGMRKRTRNDKATSPAVSPDGFGSAGSCNINVNCSTLADTWRDEQRGVVRILTVDNNGSGYCSGSVINNVAQNYKPYILTANHCMEGVTANHLNNWTFDFNYEIKNCNTPGTGPPNTQNITGATMKAQYAPSDVALLELQQNIPVEFNAYYNGWDRGGANVSGAVCIHHPAGDVKKFTLDTDINSTNSYYNDPPNGNTHFRQVWNNGTTEGGSSGSPLFNSIGNIIGQLHGGDASCTAQNAPDWFGKVSVSWAGGGTAATRLSTWLDPSSVGVVSLSGFDANTTATENGKQANPFKIYPNPAQDLAYLAYDNMVWGGQNIEIVLHTIEGKLAYQGRQVLDKETTLVAFDVKSLPAGTYVLRIKTLKGTFEDKLIKR